jgi:hypothetical protein
MSYLTSVALRQAVESTLTSALTGFKVSRFCFDIYPGSSRTLEHKSFAVGLGDTALYSPRDRQKPALGVPVTTDVLVAFVYRLRGDAQVADYDAGLSLEQTVLRAALTTSNAGIFSLIFINANRQVDGEGTVILVTLTLRCAYRLQLAD